MNGEPVPLTAPSASNVWKVWPKIETMEFVVYLHCFRMMPINLKYFKLAWVDRIVAFPSQKMYFIGEVELMVSNLYS